MTRQPTEIIESEWVYTGPAFARSHPMSRRLGLIWLVVAWVALQLVSAVKVLFDLTGRLLDGGGVLMWLLAAFLVVLILNDLLALFGLLTRNTVAWYPTWVSLICGAVFTFPLMIYWATGQRPNLIYRHRFGRLIFPASAVPR